MRPPFPRTVNRDRRAHAHDSDTIDPVKGFWYAPVCEQARVTPTRCRRSALSHGRTCWMGMVMGMGRPARETSS